MSKKKIIFDLCGGTGSWSKPYKDAGYDVRLIDIENGDDVRLLEVPTEKVHGVLAAPPCTYFCRMRMCRGRPTDEEFIGALSVVDACIRFIVAVNPEWWALENPQGYLRKWLGQPALRFHPCDYGDPWTKYTWIWGKFNRPMKFFPAKAAGSWVKEHSSSGQKSIAKSKKQRSMTPPGFAKAFFEVNP